MKTIDDELRRRFLQYHTLAEPPEKLRAALLAAAKSHSRKAYKKLEAVQIHPKPSPTSM